MILHDSAGAPTGHLHYEIFQDGNLVEVFDEKNLIVDVSKVIHAKLLGGSVTGKTVTTIGFGTNGVAALPGNTALTSAFTKALDSITYPQPNQVQFNFSLLSTEANGKAIFELGLITGDGSLYARRVRAGILSKETDISLSGSWVITF